MQKTSNPLKPTTSHIKATIMTEKIAVSVIERIEIESECLGMMSFILWASSARGSFDTSFGYSVAICS